MEKISKSKGEKEANAVVCCKRTNKTQFLMTIIKDQNKATNCCTQEKQQQLTAAANKPKAKARSRDFIGLLAAAHLLVNNNTVYCTARWGDGSVSV